MAVKKIQKERIKFALNDLEYLIERPWTLKGTKITMLRKARSQIQLALKDIKKRG